MNLEEKLNEPRMFKPYLYLLICYVFVHGFLILNQSFFWDDWIWVLNPSEFRTGLDELGVVFFKPFFFELFKQPVYVIRLFIFANYLIGSLFFYKSLKKTPTLDQISIFWCAVFFMVMPYNIIGRSSLCTMPYSVSFCLFFASYYAYLLFRKDNILPMLFVSIILSTLSFNTTSFLVLYIALFTVTELLFFKNTKQFIKTVSVVFVLVLAHSVLFYFIKSEYFPTSGVYATYNKPNFSFTMIYKLIAVHGPYFSFEPLMYALFGKDLVSSNAKTVMIVSSTVMYFPFLWLGYKRDFKSLLWLFVSVGLIFSAVFPYLAVGKQPYTYNWDSRHQLLLPLGTALWFMIVFKCLKNINIRNLLYIFSALVFSFGTIRMYLSVQGLRYQDLALQRGLAKMVDPSESASFILMGREQAPGMMNHDWNFYELTGMMYLQTGKQSNPIIMAGHYNAFVDSDQWLTRFAEHKARYMLIGAEWKPPFYCIKLIEKQHLNEWQALLYMFDEYFNNADVFDANIQKIYKFEKIKAETKDQKPIRC